jgi:hypothetical protein
MPARNREQKQHGHKQKQQNRDFMQGANIIKKVSNSRNGVPETAWSQAKTGTSCREPTTTRMSATAGMPAATRCARNSMYTSQNRDFMQAANSIKNVTNSRDANSNMVHQTQHGNKQKQELHAGSQQH